MTPTTVTGNHLLDQLQDECDTLTRKARDLLMSPDQLHLLCKVQLKNILTPPTSQSAQPDRLPVQIGLKKSILVDTQDECKSLKSSVEEQRHHSGGFSAAAKQDVKVCSHHYMRPDFQLQSRTC